MRVEDTQVATPLTNYELKIKEKIACVPSPYDLFARKEDEDEATELVRRQLDGLLAKAAFSPKQKIGYELLFVEQLSHEEVALRLGITKRNVRRLRQQIIKALSLVARKDRIMQLADSSPLTAKQKLVVSLFYGEQLSRQEIAERLGTNVTALEKQLGRIRKIIFSGRNSQECPGSCT